MTDLNTAEITRAGQLAPRALSAREEAHREELIGLMKQYDGNLAAIAREVGKGRTQVQRWLKRYALDANAFRRPW
jgi:transcriptional regulator with GAF, ATPase, and Fis domain